MTDTQHFDLENRLDSVTVGSETTQFVYDGDGNLVKKVAPGGTTTVYIGALYEVELSAAPTPAPIPASSDTSTLSGLRPNLVAFLKADRPAVPLAAKTATPTRTPTRTPTPSGPTNTPTATSTPTVTSVPPTSTGLKSPSIQSADTGGDGDGYEFSPGSAFADDSVFAADNNSGTNTITDCANGTPAPRPQNCAGAWLICSSARIWQRAPTAHRPMAAEPIAVTLLVIEALERLGVPYVIGGSLASALHGVVRATLDADLVADLRPEHAALLVRALGPAFYADGDAIRTAIERRANFNVIYLDSMFKVDEFVAGGRPLDRQDQVVPAQCRPAFEPCRYPLPGNIATSVSSASSAPPIWLS